MIFLSKRAKRRAKQQEKQAKSKYNEVSNLLSARKGRAMGNPFHSVAMNCYDYCLYCFAQRK